MKNTLKLKYNMYSLGLISTIFTLRTKEYPFTGHDSVLEIRKTERQD